jgi:hypothetical protein
MGAVLITIVTTVYKLATREIYGSYKNCVEN